MRRYLNVDLHRMIKDFEVALKKMVTTRIIGHYQSVFRGKGLEFDTYRGYMPDTDDASTIDWKASKRANELLVKEYVEERDLQILFLVDISSSMVFGSTQKLKNEYTAELTTSLAHVMLNAGDRVGFVLFNDHIVRLRMPEKSQKQFYMLKKILIDPTIYGGGYDLSKVIRGLMNSLPDSISLIFIISDFLGPRNWRKEIKMLGKKFETIGIMISDPRDRTLPDTSEQIVVEDPYSNKTELIDPVLVREKYERYARQQEEEVRTFFSEAGCDFLRLSTEKSFVVPVVTFFKMRAKKWR